MKGVYVGAKLSVQTGQPFNGYSGTRLGPALTIGARLGPSLALEVSSAYTQRPDVYQDSYTTTAGLVVEDNDTHLHTVVVPVLVRLALTKATGPWHVDALAGPTVFIYVTSRNYVQTVQGKVTKSEIGTYAEHQVSLSLGPSVRYTLTPRVKLVVDALANLPTRSRRPSAVNYPPIY